MKSFSFLAAFTVGVCAASPVWADAFLIQDAIRQAIQTHPGVGEAAANRRATEAELRQNQSTLLPQVRIEAKAGPEKSFRQDTVPPPQGNNDWLAGREASVVVRQLLFDGFASLNEIYRQTARVDAAASRVRERTELIALDAAEAYIDVVRYTRLISIARENVAAHRKILDNIQARFKGGRAGEGDLQQTLERVASADAALTEFLRSLEDARAKYRKAVGLEPFNLRGPGRLHGLPPTRDDALALTLRSNPTLQAAQSDADAAKYGFRSAGGALFSPTVSLEGRALRGYNSDSVFGYRTDMSGKVVASWDIFRGGQDAWRRTEMAERFTEQTQRLARLQRDAYESVDKAWAARTITVDRIAALNRQIDSDRKVIIAYSKEYELGQRSLIDLLNAQNQLFNALVSIESSKGVIIFADYQLLAVTGSLLSYLKEPHPVDSEPIETGRVFGLVPPRLPPILFTMPKPNGPEPLVVQEPVATEGVAVSAMASAPASTQFTERWPRWSNAANFAALKALFWEQKPQQSIAAAVPTATFDGEAPEAAAGTGPFWQSSVTSFAPVDRKKSVMWPAGAVR